MNDTDKAPEEAEQLSTAKKSLLDLFGCIGFWRATKLDECPQIRREDLENVEDDD